MTALFVTYDDHTIHHTLGVALPQELFHQLTQCRNSRGTKLRIATQAVLHYSYFHNGFDLGRSLQEIRPERSGLFFSPSDHDFASSSPHSDITFRNKGFSSFSRVSIFILTFVSQRWRKCSSYVNIDRQIPASSREKGCVCCGCWGTLFGIEDIQIIMIVSILTGMIVVFV